MGLKFILFVLFMAICGAAGAIEFVQEISIEGNGGLSARTTTDAAEDAVNGTGNQSYTRNLILGEDATTLKSEYHLSSGQQERTNHYYAKMSSLGGLEHSISVDSASDINSVSNITRTGYVVTTDYNIESKMAKMSEKIINWDDVNDEKTGNKIAETEIIGNFSVKSKLNDDGGMVDKPTGFSPAEMLEMLEDVDIRGDTGLIDTKISETEVFLQGTPKAVVRSLSPQNITLPDGTEGEVLEGNNSIRVINPDGTNGDRKNFGYKLAEDEDEVWLMSESVGVPEIAVKEDDCHNCTGIKLIDGRKIACIGHNAQVPLGWNFCG